MFLYIFTHPKTQIFQTLMSHKLGFCCGTHPKSKGTASAKKKHKARPHNKVFQLYQRWNKEAKHEVWGLSKVKSLVIGAKFNIRYEVLINMFTMVLVSMLLKTFKVSPPSIRCLCICKMFLFILSLILCYHGIFTISATSYQIINYIWNLNFGNWFFNFEIFENWWL